MAVIKNSVDLPVAYNLKTPNPLDGRTVVDTKTDLIDSTKWAASDEFYVGLPVYVKDTNEFYILNKKDDEVTVDLSSASETQKNAAYSKWTKISTFDSLAQAVKDLGPVFKFKGIATAIDPDHTTLTTGKGTIITPDGKSLPFISWGTQSRNIFNQVMYAWGTEDSILTYTEEPFIADSAVESQQFYSRGEEKTSQYINVFDTIYINNKTQNNGFNEWIDSQGNLIYTKVSDEDPTVVNVYPTSNSDGTSIAIAKPINYTYYVFNENGDFVNNYSYVVDDLHLEVASSVNNGHVYQLGEEEYASNGNMWVQLGSPKTDWIVL